MAMAADGLTILDGGMGRELLRIGAPFRQPEWSALALFEGPNYVRRVHDSFVVAGADIITTNSYAIVPFHIGEERFAAEGERLADLAGRLGQAAKAAAERPIVLAGSIPPVFGSYRPDLFRPEEAQRVLGPLVAGLAPYVDLWLAETQGSIAEAAAVRQATRAVTDRPFWVSFTLADDDVAPVAGGTVAATLRSGESVAEAVDSAIAFGAEAVLFNCSHAAVMESAVRAARATLAGREAHLRIGVYANAFSPRAHAHAHAHGKPQANSGLSTLRDDLDPAAYAALARRWQAAGADSIGGCCGIGPDHIATLVNQLRA
jgi:S-methylmethionine-dependent homocysteine/selenocysteine methylase